jgi:hypothetical protein
MPKIGPRAGVAAAAVAVLAAGGLFIGTSGASTLTPTQNTAGEAGYYVNDWGNYHIRDAHSQLTVTAAMMQLPNTQTTVNQAEGNELCDPNTGDSAQIGLLWEGAATGFEVGAQYGVLSSTPDAADPCIQDGVLEPSPAHVLIGGPTGNKVRVGDVLTLDVYYNPTAQAHGRHQIQYTACDVTTDVCRQAFDEVRAQNFFEAGIGVLNTGAPALTAPALNPLVTFASATFNNYNGSARNKLALGGWQLDEAETVNGASQVTLQPSAVVGASTVFSVAEGSASG